jgi:TolA-binding protein
MKKTDCRWVQTKLSGPNAAYMFAHERDAVSEHLNSCRECRNFKDVTSGLCEAATLIEPPELSSFIEKQIVKAALEGRIPKSAEKSGYSSKKWVMAFSLAAVTVLLFFFAFKNQITADKSPEVNTFAAKSFKNSAKQKIIFKDAPVEKKGRYTIWGTPGSVIKIIKENDSYIGIKFISGKITVDVDAHRSDRRFVVFTEFSEIEVRGTVFSVQKEDNSKEKIQVIEGIVEVRDLLNKRHMYVLNSKEQIILGGMHAEKSTINEINVQQAFLSNSYIQNSEQISSSSQKGRISHSGKKVKTDSTYKIKRAITQNHLKEALEHIEMASQNADTASRVPAFLAQLARAYRQQKKYNLTRRIYMRLIAEYENSTAALNALVALGQLELRMKGKSKSAVSHFNRYLKKAPDGYLKNEAVIGTIRANNRLGKTGEVIKIVNSYLKTIRLKNRSDELLAKEMLTFRANAFIKRGNCKAAVSDYTAILKRWPGSSAAKAARSGIDACKYTLSQ